MQGLIACFEGCIEIALSNVKLNSKTKCPEYIYIHIQLCELGTNAIENGSLEKVVD